MRVLMRVVRAYDTKPSTITIVGDSETVFAAREKPTCCFNEYYTNKIAITWENQAKLEEVCEVKPWVHQRCSGISESRYY